MNDKIDVYAKLKVFVNKFMPVLTGILLDANTTMSIGNTMTSNRAAGFGYEMASSFVSSRFAQQQQGNDASSYPLVFTFPRENPTQLREFIDKHFKMLIAYLGYEIDNKVKFFYEQVI